MSLLDAIESGVPQRMKDAVARDESAAMAFVMENAREWNTMLHRTLYPHVSERMKTYICCAAAAMDRPELLQWCIESGVDLSLWPGQPNEHWPDGWGSPPLHHAAEQGNLGCIALLLAAGAKLDQQDSVGRTPLFRASKSGHVEAVEHLLERGARVSIQDSEEQTALTVARTSGIEQILRSAEAEEPATLNRSVQSKLAGHMRTAAPVKGEDGSGEPSASRLGGHPAGEDWPVARFGVPMIFVGQIRLDELPEPHALSEGLIQVFWPPGCLGKDSGGALVRHVPTSERTAAPPADAVVLPARRIAYEQAVAEPPRRDECLDVLDGPERMRADLMNLAGDKVGGHPHWLEAPFYPRAPGRRRCRRLVLQLDFARPGGLVGAERNIIPAGGNGCLYVLVTDDAPLAGAVVYQVREQ